MLQQRKLTLKHHLIIIIIKPPSLFFFFFSFFAITLQRYYVLETKLLQLEINKLWISIFLLSIFLKQKKTEKIKKLNAKMKMRNQQIIKSMQKEISKIFLRISNVELIFKHHVRKYFFRHFKLNSDTEIEFCSLLLRKKKKR